ncbi:MAG: metallophosphoesterase, partial [Thermoleophilia bacterium]|nr:metallophosphoesterase [Thermoleophilia bacterium]
MSDIETRGRSGSGPARRAAWAVVALRIAALAAVAFCLVMLLAPGTYRVPRGSVTFELRPALPGGRIVMPLGPAGVLALQSHRTPVDVSVDYRLPDEVPTLSEAESLLRGLPEFEMSARTAFQRFVSGKAFWLLGLGAGVGLLIAGPRRFETALLAAGFGAAGALALGGAFALVTLATVDHTPEVRYEGLASNVPRLLPLLRGLEAQEAGRLERLPEYVEGLQLVALDLQREIEGSDRPADVRRVLLFSDLHTNVFGMRYAARLALGGDDPVDLVLVAGDVTDGGTRDEAELFLRLFSPPKGIPVLLIGGNHEDRPAMDAFTQSDFTVLDWESAAAAGLTVYGVSDPLAASSQVDSDTELLAAQEERLAALWPELDTPDVLMVHDVRQAERTIELAEEAGEPLVVAYGHDHVLAVSQRGAVVLVDPGTSGASGYGSLGRGEEIPYTFQLLDFSLEGEARLVAVTSVSYA